MGWGFDNVVPMLYRNAVVFMATLMSSCSANPNDLSRSEAKRVISRDIIFNQKYSAIHWVGRGYQTWVDEGGFKNTAFWGLINDANAAQLTLMIPIGVRLDEITGITDSNSTACGGPCKEAQFKWSMPNIPVLLRPTMVSGGTGTAFLKLYDDGWRLAGALNIVENLAIPQLSTAETAQVERFKAEERTRLSNKLAASRTPTKELARFKATVKTSSASGTQTADGTVVLTDVALIVPDAVEIGLQNTVSLGCMAPTLGHKMKIASPTRQNFQVPEFSIAFRGGPRAGCGQYDAHFTVGTPEEASNIFEQIFKAHEAWVAVNGGR
jgi:hypothetical protein